MSESANYRPWIGHDMSSSRTIYRETVIDRRSYDEPKSSGKSSKNSSKDVIKEIAKRVSVPEYIETQSKYPIIFLFDITGSMKGSPAVFFEKVPMISQYIENDYFEKGAEICIIAFGDAKCDNLPLQVFNFAIDRKLKETLMEIDFKEKGGGSGLCETSEQALLYVLKNIKMTNAVRPVVFLVTDEKSYDSVSVSSAQKHAKVDLQQEISTKEICHQLMEKCELFILRKIYDTSSSDIETNENIHEHWKNLVGDDRISVMETPDRLADITFGILAKVTGKLEYFKKEIEERQRPDQVLSTYHSLSNILGPDFGKNGEVHGESVMVDPESKLSMKSRKNVKPLI